jgi:hypothetical protein
VGARVDTARPRPPPPLPRTPDAVPRWARRGCMIDPAGPPAANERFSAPGTEERRLRRSPSPGVARSPWRVDSPNDKEPQISQIEEIDPTRRSRNQEGGGAEQA